MHQDFSILYMASHKVENVCILIESYGRHVSPGFEVVVLQWYDPPPPSPPLLL